MPPKLLSDDKRNCVIRPLAYCKEADITEFAALREYPIIPCNLCGSQDGLQRVQIKRMLTEWEKQQPGRLDNIFRSLQSVSPSQLADTDLFDFQSLRVGKNLNDEATGALSSATDWLLDGERKASIS